MNPADPILEFDSVRVERTPENRWDVGLEPVSFRLMRGEQLMVDLEREALRHPLPDLACGISPPDAGTIRFCGDNWLDRTPDEASAQRGRIGQVFGATAWLSNLDLDENITLPLRYHARMDPAAAKETALVWARFFGLEQLPSGRPGRARHETLQVAQWIRAFSVQPDLLLLDRPGDRLSAEWNRRLSQAVDRERARGAAVLWLTESANANPAVTARCRGDRLDLPNRQPGDER